MRIIFAYLSNIRCHLRQMIDLFCDNFSRTVSLNNWWIDDSEICIWFLKSKNIWNSRRYVLNSTLIILVPELQRLRIDKEHSVFFPCVVLSIFLHPITSNNYKDSRVINLFNDLFDNAHFSLLDHITHIITPLILTLLACVINIAQLSNKNFKLIVFDPI
jgi:hypothetical protein